MGKQLGSPASVAMVGNQSRRSTLNSNSESESLKQSDVMFSFIVATPAKMLVPCVFASAFSLDNIGGVERRDVLHGKLSISHKIPWREHSTSAADPWPFETNVSHHNINILWVMSLVLKPQEFTLSEKR